MTIICSIILFITWSFSFLNAIRISKVPGHYINRKIQYSTARTAVESKDRWIRKMHILDENDTLIKQINKIDQYLYLREINSIN